MKTFGFITLKDREDVSYFVEIEKRDCFGSCTIVYNGNSVDTIRHLADMSSSFLSLNKGFWCIIPKENIVSLNITKIEL